MMKIKYFPRIFAVVCFVVFFLTLTNAFCATLRVPLKYPTIQAAINAASSGDTVLVSAGIYNEAITLSNGVMLKSKSGASVTILDGTDLSTSVVTMASNSVLDGFTIQNGTTGTDWFINGLGACQVGGGIYCNTKTNVTIKNCIISDNAVAKEGGAGNPSVWGAGIFATDTTNSTISNCTFSNNTVLGGEGGGLAIVGYRDNSWTITDCTFNNNNSVGYGYFSNAGALTISGARDTAVTITNCNFNNNTAEGMGGAIRTTGGANSIQTVTISGCTFYNNTADLGGAVTLEEGITIVNNCLFYANTTSNPIGGAGNLRVSSEFADAIVSFNNCTVANNIGSGIEANLDAETVKVTARNCIFYNNSSYEIMEQHVRADVIPINCCFYNSASGLFLDEASGGLIISQINSLPGASGNIELDPLFVDAGNNDFHLSFDSPCIDLGDDASEYEAESEPNGNRINIGNYGNTAGATTSIGFVPNFDGQVIDISTLPVKLIEIGGQGLKREVLSFNAIAAHQPDLNIEVQKLPSWLKYQIISVPDEPVQVIFYMDDSQIGQVDLATVTIIAANPSIPDESLSMKATFRVSKRANAANIYNRKD